MRRLVDNFFLIGLPCPNSSNLRPKAPVKLKTLSAKDFILNTSAFNQLMAPPGQNRLSLDRILPDSEMNIPSNVTQNIAWTEFETQREKLTRFALPFGAKAKHTRIRDNLENLNKELLREESGGFATEFFFLALNPRPEGDGGARLSVKEIQQISLDISFPGFQYETPDIDSVRQMMLLRGSNPNGFDFFFCVRQEEVFISRPPPQVAPGCLDLFRVPSLFVIQTRIPASKFFCEVMLQIAAVLRRGRLEAFMKHSAQIMASVTNMSKFAVPTKLLQTVNSRRVRLNVVSELHRLMDSLQAQNPVVTWGRELAFEEGTCSSKFNFLDMKLTPVMEAQCGFGTLLTLLSFEDVVFILFSMLFEVTVVFVSEHLSLISSALATFNALLRPFKWSFPIIYSLPEECLLMLESPLPLQVGINMTAHRFLSSVAPVHLPKLNSDSSPIIVFLDESLVMANAHHTSTLDLPFFDDCLVIPHAIYRQELSSKSSSSLKLSKKKAKNNLRKYSFSRINKYTIKERISKLKKRPLAAKKAAKQRGVIKLAQLQARNASPQIFSCFRAIIDKFVISKLPRIKEGLNSVSMDQSSLSSVQLCGELRTTAFSANPYDQQFLKRLFSTQTFHYYLEHDYLQASN